LEATEAPFSAAASAYAGVMLAPEREAETAPAFLRELGHAGVAAWRAAYPQLLCNGSLVVAGARDQSELDRFAQRTYGHSRLDERHIEELEPDLAQRFSSALYFAGEAHMPVLSALSFMLDAARSAGADIVFGQGSLPEPTDVVVDCRGIQARELLPGLRGVRGERIVVRSREIDLRRPVQLLHPRHAFYIVPWGGGVHLIGATVLETDDDKPITVRSALELLGAAYALHPAFAEAEVIEQGAGVRPAFLDNVPRAVVRSGGRLILVNGAYRHGFLLAPVLASTVANYLDSRAEGPLLQIED
jgi:glycine oxidase